jgi:hypothetical protein
LDSGALHSVALPTFAEANDALSRVRKDRTVEIGKKSIGVTQAVIVTQNAGAAQVVKTVNVAAEARREAIVAEAAKAKAKADAAKVKADEKSAEAKDQK